ncbi:MAG: porphobilinogen synthase [Nitrosopumilus sp.]|nr:porphobilinogen synthase [Nitrosopumilus sp.]MDA7957723.1 porphobilinogen synthase [Nitrosopumilus sp.]
MPYPARRLRRLRTTGAMRELATEVRLSVKDLVCPVFVREGGGTSGVGSMPGTRVMSEDSVCDEVQEIADLGIPGVMLFGIPSAKDAAGSSAAGGVVQRAISSIREVFGDGMVVMADVCLCQYTDSGHCGIVRDGRIDNDESTRALAAIAASHAEAGVDTVSPSAMMDGQVAAIRAELDEGGFRDVSIMSHSAKHRSGMYAPFRDAASCAPSFGDRSTYQVPYSNPREAMQELEEDVAEGVDIVMVKPALAYLDIIHEARRRLGVPVAAYSVSGEYAMVRAAADAGYLDGDAATMEILTSIRRAGAGIIVTYMAKQAAGLLR